MYSFAFSFVLFSRSRGVAKAAAEALRMRVARVENCISLVLVLDVWLLCSSDFIDFVKGRWG